MPDLTIYGASDDLVEVEGVVSEEFNTERGDLLVVAPDGRQLRVLVLYAGEWIVGVKPGGEDVRGFEGRMVVEGYTAKLVLDVPEGTTVHELQRRSPRCEVCGR